MSGDRPADGLKPSVTTEAFATHGALVRVTGDLDLALASSLACATAGEIAHGHRHIVFDLSAATFLDCAGVGSLMAAVAPLRHEPDATVVLAGATGPVERVLTLLELDRVFEILGDVEHGTEVALDPDRRRVEGWRGVAASTETKGTTSRL